MSCHGAQWHHHNDHDDHDDHDDYDCHKDHDDSDDDDDEVTLGQAEQGGEGGALWADPTCCDILQHFHFDCSKGSFVEVGG